MPEISRGFELRSVWLNTHSFFTVPHWLRALMEWRSNLGLHAKSSGHWSKPVTNERRDNGISAEVASPQDSFWRQLRADKRHVH